MIPELVRQHWVVLALIGMLLGIDKGGIKAISILSVYFMLDIVDPKTMLAIYAPLMLVGELFPAWHYRKDADFSATYRIFPWIVAGLFVGTVIGTRIDVAAFSLIIGILILGMAILMVAGQFRDIKIGEKAKKPLTVVLGSLAGFGSIIGNVAGGITNVYFLSETDNKRQLIGSSSLLFVQVNAIKLLLYVFLWQIFTANTLLVSLYMVPSIAFGMFLATLFVRMVPERVYRSLVFLAVIYAGISLLAKNL
jgi:uncharacterized membrane protein YfcA